MKQIPDSPHIRAAEATGYAPWQQEETFCPRCQGAISNLGFVVDDETICQDCFIDWLSDYAKTNPTDIAAALSVETVYNG